MIKKLLFTTALLIAGTILLKAQCTINASCLKGICPDTITNLPTAHVTVSYSTSLTVVVPIDTVYLTQTIPIDSINYTSTTGLPTGFTVTPDKSGWPGGTKGCILIAGTPADSMQGRTYKLTITTTVHGKYMTIPVSLPVTYTGYKIFVKDTVLGINEANEQHGISFITDQSSNSVTIIVHSSSGLNNASVIISDITGRELMQLNNINGTDFTINKGNLSNGIYIISLMDKENVLAKRKIVIR